MVRSVFMIALVLCASCQKPNAPEAPTGEGALLLKAVGSARVEADKNQALTLDLVAAIAGVGPSPDLEVQVAFVNGEKGELYAGSYKTDEDGFLSIPYHAPDEDNATVMISAKAEGAPSLTFTVFVARDTVNIAWDGRKPRLMKKGTEDELVVIASNQRGAPVPNVRVRAELVSGSDYGAELVGEREQWSDGSGQASFRFVAGTALTTYKIRASADRVNAAELEVVVVEELPENDHCEFKSDCKDSQICVEGACVEGSRRCRVGHAEDCPSGYSCEANICVGGCAGGSCNAPPGADLDVTGLWYTQYVFSLQESLGMLRDLGAPLADLDTLLQGKIPGKNVPIWGTILEVMLEALIKAYVPDWTPKLASALNDLFTALGEVVIAGRMQLSPQVSGSNVLLGEETWDKFELKLPSLCPRRQNDPSWPRCATVNVQLGRDLGSGTQAKATAMPFVGVIEGKLLSFTGRQASMELNKALANIVDLIGNIATNGRAKTIEKALPLIVDCAAMEQPANALACDVTNGAVCNLSWFVPACKAVAKGLGAVLGVVLEKVPLEWTLVDFHQSCQARDTSSPANVRADVLDNGTVLGRTNLVADKPMSGTFNAKR